MNLGLSYDLFTRTTTGNHIAVTKAMFAQVRDNGYLIEKRAMAAISPSSGRALPDRYIEGTCPLCGAGGARGDQCDNCGKQLDPIDLIDPVSKINGETPSSKKPPTISWIFPHSRTPSENGSMNARPREPGVLT